MLSCLIIHKWFLRARRRRVLTELVYLLLDFVSRPLTFWVDLSTDFVRVWLAELCYLYDLLMSLLVVLSSFGYSCVLLFFYVSVFPPPIGGLLTRLLVVCGGMPIELRFLVAMTWLVFSSVLGIFWLNCRLRYSIYEAKVHRPKVNRSVN